MSNYHIFNEVMSLDYLSSPVIVAQMVSLLADMIKEEMPKANEAILGHDLTTFKSILHGWNGSLGYFVEPYFAKQMQELEQLACFSGMHGACLNFWQVVSPGLQTLMNEAYDYAQAQQVLA